MKKPHVFNSRNIDVLEMEDRRIWENPEEILGTVEIKAGFVAADLGCGSGFFTIPLSGRVKKVFAIDVQRGMLGFLGQKIEKMGIKNVELLLSRGSKIPLENESVDLLISINTLHEFDDLEKMIEEMSRVLKHGGKALIVDFKKEDTGFGPPVAIRFSKKQAKDCFERKGFATVKLRDLTFHYLLVFSNDKPRQ